LKWPNDVLVDGAKIAGILLEAGEGWLSIGVGINLEHHPDDLPYPVTHLLEHISEADLNKPEPIYAGPEPILAQLAHNIGQGMAELKIEGFVATRRTWLAKAARLGEEISVNLGGETVTGKFETIGNCYRSFMLLAIDTGNTNTLFAIHDGKEWLIEWRIATDSFRTADEYAVWLHQLLEMQKLTFKDVTPMF